MFGSDYSRQRAAYKLGVTNGPTRRFKGDAVDEDHDHDCDGDVVYGRLQCVLATRALQITPGGTEYLLLDGPAKSARVQVNGLSARQETRLHELGSRELVGRKARIFERGGRWSG
jgi:hypothetical protein